ncbi:hypothetical protein DD876_06745 [Staphylococcus pseudintermedius]|nr:hypothetical protein DD876_06745 [Staphylococcus pseudintermedius]
MKGQPLGTRWEVQLTIFYPIQNHSQTLAYHLIGGIIQVCKNFPRLLRDQGGSENPIWLLQNFYFNQAKFS